MLLFLALVLLPKSSLLCCGAMDECLILFLKQKIIINNMCSNEENIIVKPDNNKVSLHHTAMSSLVSLLEYNYPMPEEKKVNIIEPELIPHIDTTTTSPTSLNTTSPSITDKAKAKLETKKKRDSLFKSQNKKKKVSFAKKFVNTVDVKCWKKYNVIDTVPISLLRRRNVLEDEATTKCVCAVF